MARLEELEKGGGGVRRDRGGVRGNLEREKRLEIQHEWDLGPEGLSCEKTSLNSTKYATEVNYE